ncbi:MAG: methylthioribulose 1-phosphate dehydratase [Alicyclobacillus sp.]|nr:methylthioribulose 1-phosphate dehydratase [Alicyclobacillus sp.]
MAKTGQTGGLDWHEAVQTVSALARALADKGWLPATSGNLSVRTASNPLEIAVTRSGADKQRLQAEDVLRVDAFGQVLGTGQGRPSAETSVHLRLYEKLHCGAVLHVHTVWNNLISDLAFPAGGIAFADHELLKALGHWQEHARVVLPVVENHADLQRLAAAVAEVAQPQVPGVLVRRHGIYAWGDDAAAALRHLEAWEFLFEFTLRRRSLGIGD